MSIPPLTLSLSKPVLSACKAVEGGCPSSVCFGGQKGQGFDGLSLDGFWERYSA